MFWFRGSEEVLVSYWLCGDGKNFVQMCSTKEEPWKPPGSCSPGLLQEKKETGLVKICLKLSRFGDIRFLKMLILFRVLLSHRGTTRNSPESVWIHKQTRWRRSVQPWKHLSLLWLSMGADGRWPPSPPQTVLSSSFLSFVTFPHQRILNVLVNAEAPYPTGVLTPAPCYSTTTLSIEGLGGVVVPYYLSEERGWELQVEELHRALESCKGACHPIALYVINPGNPAGAEIPPAHQGEFSEEAGQDDWRVRFWCPAGQVQSRKSMQEVIRFASEKRLFLLADEVGGSKSIPSCSKHQIKIIFSSSGLSRLHLRGKGVCLVQKSSVWNGASSVRHGGAGVLSLSIQRLYGRVSSPFLVWVPF